MMKRSLGPMSTLTKERARIVSISDSTPPRQSVLVVLSSVGVRAYWNMCQHVPTPLGDETTELISEDAIVCRSHGARYTLENGVCFLGPCRGKWLEPVDIEIIGDEIFAQNI